MKIINFFSKLNLVVFVISGLIFLIDRITKEKIIELQTQNEKSIYVNDYLNFDLIWNSGIGFGLFSLEANFFYHLITFLIFIIILVIIILIFRSNKKEKFMYSLILGGALGNLFDRIIYFSVPDFIDLHFDNYHWFSFNIADIFISIGIIFILINELGKINETN
jgi:signal peptidase II|tara:strand:+ start:55 stop:546 length:492 start_codon:yes stop_codon:yes gene_type:complete